MSGAAGRTTSRRSFGAEGAKSGLTRPRAGTVPWEPTRDPYRPWPGTVFPRGVTRAAWKPRPREASRELARNRVLFGGDEGALSLLARRFCPTTVHPTPAFGFVRGGGMRLPDPGFSVRVLVRNLYSSTLNLLGTGAAFAQGDLTDYRSIVDAVSGVDKVTPPGIGEY